MTEGTRPADRTLSRDETLLAAIDRFRDHAFVTLDSEGIVTSWSVGAERIFACSREQTVGTHLSAVFTRGAGVRIEDLQQAERLGSVSSSRWLTYENGTRRCVRTTVVAVSAASTCVGYVALAHDVDADDRGVNKILTARIEDTTRRLSDSNALLAAEVADRTQAEAARIRLLRRLVVAQEEERRRIARDLHDDLGQRLTALRLTLEADDDERSGRREPISKALQMLASIDHDLDFLAWELRPAALDELGLARVLESYVCEWSRHAGIHATFHVGAADIDRLAPEVEASLYRIAQEALNNVAKHARAQSVNVLLERRDDTVVLVVEDDGIGFPSIGSTETMIGLVGMRERAAAMGGTLEIEPTPNGGSTVLMRIPIYPSARTEPLREGARDEATAVLLSGAMPSAGAASGAVVHSMRVRLQELQSAIASRDEFIATVAHELRNPISPLMFQLRLAIERAEQIASAGEAISGDWVQSQLRRIEQRLHRLLETLDRLLDVSRLSTGRIDLQPEPMDLAEAVRDVIGTFDAELAVARCKVSLVERGVATGSWDRLRLEQICRNLLSNAIRFGAGRPIDVIVEADEDVATLQVRDHGVGIEPDQQARIFERFERGPEQRSGGFGIGLWVVKNICVAMGGTITVESQLGEGARFTVVLPRRRAREFVDGPTEDE